MQYFRSIIRYRMHIKVTNCLSKLSTYHSHSETINKGNEQEIYVSFIVFLSDVRNWQLVFWRKSAMGSRSSIINKSPLKLLNRTGA